MLDYKFKRFIFNKQLNGAEYVGRSMVVKEALPKN